MPAKETIVFCVHGANQSDSSEQKNYTIWEQAFDLEPKCREVRDIVNGGHNDEIRDYHGAKHSGCEYPIYKGWSAAWYGEVWQQISQLSETERFNERLNPSYDGERDERKYLLERIERKAMKTHFDELVSFYELTRCANDNITLYEKICAKVLADLVRETDNGEKDYVILAHSMGCAVSYNILSHISRMTKGLESAAIKGALSTDYARDLEKFIEAPGKPLGLLTFGNYMGYNWAQKANTRILYGTRTPHYHYPDACPRWFNFWTTLGGDPYIIDDMLENTIISDENDSYDDVRVLRLPFISNIGHGRHSWFERNSFMNGLNKKLTKHLYR